MNQITISIKALAGTFAENKDIARELRLNRIVPALNQKQIVIIDFSDVTGTTQSFMHALISDTIRIFGVGVVELLHFKNCSPVVKEVVNIVFDYMQES